MVPTEPLPPLEGPPAQGSAVREQTQRATAQDRPVGGSCPSRPRRGLPSHSGSSGKGWLSASLLLPLRSPPRPSPGSLHYSDEDVTKYNDLIPAESSSLTEKPSEISDSQVRGRGARRPGEGSGAAPSESAARHMGLLSSFPFWSRKDGGGVVCEPAVTSQALLRVCSRADGAL